MTKEDDDQGSASEGQSTLSDAEWEKLLKEFNIDLDAVVKEVQTRPVTQAEIDFLLRQYAFLELSDSDTESLVLESVTPEIITAKSGWNIHDHGNLLVVSPGRWLFGPYTSKGDDGNGSGGREFTGSGTIIKQIIDSADSMIALASKRWSAAYVRGGYELMKFAAWTFAQQRGFDLSGFEPTRHEQDTFKKILQIKGLTLPGMELEERDRPR